MDIKKLEYFLAVCEYKSFSKASQALYISQQGISRIINSMEQELACTLFLRTKRGVLLTKEGELTFQYANRICREYHSMLRELEQEKKSPATMTLAVTPGILYTYWDVLNQLEKSGVNLLELYDYQCDKAVKEETACMGIGVEPVDTSLFDVIPLAHHPLYAICSESHPLAQKTPLLFQIWKTNT